MLRVVALLTLRGPQGLPSHSPMCWWPCCPRGLLASPPAPRLAGTAGWWDVGFLLLGLAGHPHGGGLSFWATRPAIPAAECDAPSAACPAAPRTVQPPWPWLLAVGEPKSQVQGHINFFVPLKHIAKCQEGLSLGALCSWGSSFAFAGEVGYHQPCGTHGGAKPGSMGTSLAPVPRPSVQTIQSKSGVETFHEHIRFGPVIAVINPLPPSQPPPGAQPLGAGGNEAPGRS